MKHFDKLKFFVVVEILYVEFSINLSNVYKSMYIHKMIADIFQL